MDPALEITTSIDELIAGAMCCGPPRHNPGGGGITVARIAHLLGAPTLGNGFQVEVVEHHKRDQK